MGFEEFVRMADGAVQSHLGGPVVYRPFLAAPIVLTGVFWAEYEQQDPADPGARRGPAVFLLLADLPGVDPTNDRGAVVVAGGVEYSVQEPRLDGHGGVLLHLVRRLG